MEDKCRGFIIFWYSSFFKQMHLTDYSYSFLSVHILLKHKLAITLILLLGDLSFYSKILAHAILLLVFQCICWIVQERGIGRELSKWGFAEHLGQSRHLRPVLSNLNRKQLQRERGRFRLRLCRWIWGGLILSSVLFSPSKPLQAIIWERHGKQLLIKWV